MPALLSEVYFVLSYISNCGVTVVVGDFGVCLFASTRSPEERLARGQTPRLNG
jgi:hypothetical protein